MPLFDCNELLRQVKVFPGSVSDAVEAQASCGGPESLGAVFTRPEVVDFILDLAGYTEDRPLSEKRLLEPSFGEGGFVLPAIRRLMASWRKAKPEGAKPYDLAGAVRAVELRKDSFRRTRALVEDLLRGEGLDGSEASALAGAWLIQGDFLLTAMEEGFDFVVGNPPYIRPELIPIPLLKEYRSIYHTMYDRADLYVPFIERSLSLLAEGGSLAFICSDRWMKNRYGGPLRNFVSERFRLKYHVDMEETPAFRSDVSAYASVVVISRESRGAARIARRPEIGRTQLAALAKSLSDSGAPASGGPVSEIGRVARGKEPWLLDASGKAALIRRLEGSLPLLEEAGCKVGIGVATGADKAFISRYETMEVEPSRKLPLVTAKDTASGEVRWGGLGVLNPFLDSGRLADVREFPLMARWLEDRRDVIASRRIARNSPGSWYRTIDRIHPWLAGRPKLLIPDIKSEAHAVFDAGKFYPSHNLYYVISDEWELSALQGVLLSSVTNLFISAYSTPIRGGSVRFQAQYLRRIRLPRWKDAPGTLRSALSAAALIRDLDACDEAAFELYGLRRGEREILRRGPQ